MSKKQLKRNFSIRQLKYKHNRLIGMSQYNAALAAGYSHVAATKNSHRIERAVAGGIAEAIERAGGTNKVIATRLVDMALNANKVQNATLLITTENGERKVIESKDDFIEIPDNKSRLDAMRLIGQFKKQIGNDASGGTQAQQVVIHLTIPGENAQGNQHYVDAETSVSVETPEQS